MLEVFPSYTSSCYPERRCVCVCVHGRCVCVRRIKNFYIHVCVCTCSIHQRPQMQLLLSVIICSLLNGQRERVSGVRLRGWLLFTSLCAPSRASKSKCLLWTCVTVLEEERREHRAGDAATLLPSSSSRARPARRRSARPGRVIFGTFLRTC